MNDARATENLRDGAGRGARRPAGEDDPLGAALRGLPAERAGAGFAARVLARLDERDAARRGALDRAGAAGRRPALLGPAGWAALAAAVLAVALGLALVRGWAPPSGDTIAGSESAPPEAPEAAPPRGSAPGVSDRSHLAGSGADPTGAAGDRVSDSTLSAGTSPPAAVTPRTAGLRPAAAGAESAGSRVRAVDRGAGVVPDADARSTLERIRAELDALRREHRAFEVALAELPEIGRDGQPVVFLGGDEGLGLVLDLGRDTAAGDDPEAGPRSPSL